jgi:flagellar hook-length control protein FliK
MPTGLQLFDLSVQTPAAKGQKAVEKCAKPAADEKSTPMDGFAEIMNALLAMPKEQLKDSLSDLDATDLAAGSPGGDTDPPQIEADGKDVTLAELLQLIANMKGVIPQALQSAESGDKPNLLLDMAKAFLQDPQAFARSFAKGKGNSLAPQLAQQVGSKVVPPLARNAIPEEAQLALEGSGQSLVVPVADQRTGKRIIQPADAVKLDSEKKPLDDISLSLKAATPEKATAKASQHQSQGKDFLFQTSDPQTDGTSKQDAVTVKPMLATGLSKTPVADSLPDKEIKSNAKGHPCLSVADVQNAAAATVSDADGVNEEKDLLQKPVSPNGGQQGILSRMVARQDPGGVPISDDKAVMQQDKAAQADVIRQIVQRMSMHTQGSQSKMVIQLKPEFLGNVHMQVVTENHQVTVRMMADSTMVKDIVEQNLQHLRSELLHHGLEIQKFDVFVANDEQGWRGGQQQAGFSDTLNRKQSRSGAEKSKSQRGKVVFNVRNRKQNTPRDLSEIDYFA